MLTSLFGISIRYEMWQKQEELPLYIAGSYEFYIAYIDDRRCIVMKPLDELATLPAIRKQIIRIQEIENIPVVLELETISPYRRKSLIANRIPFITRKQVYLPFIGTVLGDEEKEKQCKKFVPSTQQLFLFYLYSKQKKLYVSEATKRLSFSAMTMSRAVKQLEATDLFIVSKDGVHKVIESQYKKHELFEKAKKYLFNPIKKHGYINESEITKDMVVAGETALAETTMLNPSKLRTYAVSEKNYDKNNLQNELIEPEKQICLELWAYDPRIFTTGNRADNLSVILSFEGNEDERIEESIEQLLKRELGE